MYGKPVKTTTISVKLADADLAKLDQLVVVGLVGDINPEQRGWRWVRRSRGAALRALIRDMDVKRAKALVKEDR